MPLFLALVLFVAVSGCTTIKFGNDFDPKDFEQWAKRGETTQAQVLGRLGPPTSKGAVVEHDGTYYTRWTYYHGKGKIYRLEDANLKVLEIRFNSEKKVVSFNWSAPVPEQKE
jgi:outer membrane protein assembly factor BamE (lipoprotein component of BamABCDE complex)